MIDYLAFDDVIAIHADRRRRLGLEPSPLRDEEALRGVVKLPEAAVHYEGADIALQAAVLVVGIAHLKPFVASNDLTAFACLEIFLDLNGYALNGGGGFDLATYLRLITGEHDFEHALSFFAAQLRRRIQIKP